MGTALCPLRNGLPAAGRCGTCSGNAPQALPQVGSVAAAVIAGIVCFAAWWAVPEQGGDSRSLLTEENREKPTLVKTLEDGSVVYLAQESTLKYPEHFAEDKREVNLQGEAFFDVAKKPEQAFTIETARVRVEVLGTAFNVRSNEGAPFSLSVKRGKVKVLLKQEEQTVFVEAGETVILQGAVCSSARRRIRSSLTVTPATSVSRTSAWRMCCVLSIRSLPAGR